MNEKLRNHIEMLFEQAPKTRKALELKEELLTNSEERYQDLLASGISAEDAYKNVISSIGNVSELFQGLEDDTPQGNTYNDADYKKLALIKAAAVGIYIFSVVIFLGFCLYNEYMFSDDIFGPGFPFNRHVNYSAIGIMVMIIIDIIPTCMLVYCFSRYPRYRKQANTVVEDFKEWKSGVYRKKSIKGAVLAVVWASALLIYFTVSFITFAWYATWIFFLVAICVHAIVELLFRLKELKE